MRPAITCMMAVQPGRLDAFRQSVGDYYAQRYPNKQLALVTKYPQYDLTEYRDWLQRDPRGSTVSWTHVSEPTTSPGTLLNTLLNKIATPLYTLWPCGDRHATDQLEIQYAAMLGQRCNACYLMRQFYFFPATRRIYLVSFPRLLSSVGLLFDRSDARFEVEDLKRPDASFLRTLNKDRLVVPVTNSADTYLRVIGDNCGPSTHKPLQILASSNAMSAEKLLSLRAWIEHVIRRFQLPLPVKVSTRGDDVFTVS